MSGPAYIYEYARPRRCGCGAPVLMLTDGRVVDDRPVFRGEAHDDCFWECVVMGVGEDA